MCLSDFGMETLRSAFRGRRDSVRLFKATPPAIPARAAPPATSGVFAFEANSATFPPALLTCPFELLVRRRDAVVERDRVALEERRRDEFPRFERLDARFPDERAPPPFLLTLVLRFVVDRVV